MEILIKLLICQLIIQDIIQISFIWMNTEWYYVLLNALSLSICLLLVIIDYYKIQQIYFKVGLLILCVINCETLFQLSINIASAVQLFYILLILFKIYENTILTKMIVHLVLVYMVIRAIIAYSDYRIQHLLLIIFQQPLNHYIFYSLRKKSFSQQTQAQLIIQQNSQEQVICLSNDSKQDNLKCDLNESVIVNQIDYDFESPRIQQEHKSIGTNKNTIEQRVIIKKPINVWKTTTNSSDSPQQESIKIENNMDSKYSDLVAIMSNLPFGIIFVDQNLTILEYNQKVSQLLGITNPNKIIPFLDEAIKKSGEIQEVRSAKKIKKSLSKSPKKSYFHQQPSINLQKRQNDDQISDLVSQFYNCGSQSRMDNESQQEGNLRSIFQKFQKIHQSQQTAASRETFQFIIRLDSMDTSYCKSKYKSLKLKIFQIDGNGLWEQNVYLFVLENITKREELKLLNHKYKFQQALLNSLCHELRTPINGVISQLYALKDELMTDLIQSHLNPAIVSTKRLQYQLNDILDYAQIQCKALTLNKSYFKLEEIYQQLQELFNFECIQKQIQLVIEDDHQIRLHTDKERLLRIFINLLDNSVKFTNKGGTIKVSSEIDKDQLKFIVYDNGQGIKDEIIEKIEEQAEMLFKDSVQYHSNKLGLGLRISMLLSDYLYKEQKFQIESKFNQYTKISFRLSNLIENYSSEFQMGAQLSILEKNCNCSKILIVDDIICNHFALQVLLKKFKVKTDSAYNGNSAIELVEERLKQQCCQTYRLIFMDIEMPQKNGFQASSEISQKLRQNSLNEECIITMYSAYSGDDDVLIASQCGMKERISKPTDIQKLEHIIRKYIL
ncbi:unnamed protein product (macronuclear) [Paramecium tetraurelia]|uniref:Uncharacterized protein n=1 Tax=Paramecium tetraurelia TaxID=5888 RepID=A0D7W6_PARTE|nr:uncharacterized protein GSPATT00014100001 [Paramecium tetraurelia]CAK79133.1 unnamed protein product [Paramecium tetraurelia]|eukprot:XP_001446530.1 hypothetical protein (macronuclear) [Paramecium tetraurelia strain d4-2]